MRWVLVIPAVLGASACAPSRSATWQDVPARIAAPPPTPLPAPEPRERTPNDRAVELGLLHFGPERKRTAEHWPPADRWPMDVQDVWLRHGADLERALAVDQEVGRRVLMHARVATEVELDLTTARFGPCPDAVAERLGKVFGLIAHHMRAARVTPPPRPRDFSWPVAPIVLTSGFGYRHDPLSTELRFHAGIDLGGQIGDVVGAASLGRVIHAGWMGGYGRAVILEHTDGLQTLYGHLAEVLVELGTEVRGGDAIGLMGSSGRSTAPHLHFEVRRAGAAIDPLELLGLHDPRASVLSSEADDG